MQASILSSLIVKIMLMIMQFLWQGAKTQIGSISKHKKLLVRQETLCIFSLKYVSIFEKNKFSLSPLESQDQVISSRKLSTLACFAVQRYFENLTNECSFTYLPSSLKCKFCWNWLRAVIFTTILFFKVERKLYFFV